MPANRNPGIHIAWKTITYRSVAMAVVCLIVLAGLVVNALFPRVTHAGAKAVTSVLEKLAGDAGATDSKPTTVAQQAHFTDYDGTVRVKKANSNSWLAADYNVPLEKGDVVQTGSEGMAKIVFNDGTNYTIKQDSLIVIEENSATSAADQRGRERDHRHGGPVHCDIQPGIPFAGDRGRRDRIAGPGKRGHGAQRSAGDQHEILLKKGRATWCETARMCAWRLGKSHVHSDRPRWRRRRKSGRQPRSLRRT